MGEANARAANGEGEASGVHRLRDILVEEVSLVDLAANKRRFLVVKRSEAMADEKKAGPALKPEGGAGASGSGGAEKAKKKPPAGATAGGEEKPKKPAPHGNEPKSAEKARGAEGEGEAERSGGDEGGNKKERRKAEGALLLKGPLKEAALRVLAGSLERLMRVAQRIKEAEETAEAPGERLPEEVVGELAAIAGELRALGGGGTESATKALVGKAGARMAKDRLARFQKAMALLAEILKEITDSSGTLPAPTAGAAQAGVEKREAAPASALAGLSELAASISELTRVVKLQGDELAGIRKARGLSNALTLEASPRSAEPQDVPWPLDMNRPISRDKVRKEVSFFDEE